MVSKGTETTGDIAAQVATDKTRALARELGAQATTMLKNENIEGDSRSKRSRPLLPLRRDAHRRVVVVGSPDPSGHGSGAVAPSDSVSVHRAVEEKLSREFGGPEALADLGGDLPRPRDGALDAAAAGAAASALGAEDTETETEPEMESWARWYPVDAVGEAAEAARDADVAVVVVGVSSAESLDRPNLELGEEQNAAVRAMVAANPRTVVVVMTPGAVLMPWRDDVPAILVPFLPGEAGGYAVADVLFGDAEPGGRLPVTMPAGENDLGWSEVQYPGVDATARYLEGLNVGYRGYDALGVDPAYPFGFGLSYAGPFEYHGGEILDGAEEGAKVVTFEVTNAHETRAGYETSQVYLGYPSNAGEPPKQLRAFFETGVRSGGEEDAAHGAAETRDERVGRQDARVARSPGEYKVYVGSHARAMRRFPSRSTSTTSESRRDNGGATPSTGAVDHPTTPPTRRSIARNNTRQVTRHTRGDERERRRRAVDTRAAAGASSLERRSGVGFPSENRRKRKRSDPRSDRAFSIVRASLDARRAPPLLSVPRTTLPARPPRHSPGARRALGDVDSG